jgi:Ca2+-binding RTX toxin-like protein
VHDHWGLILWRQNGYRSADDYWPVDRLPDVRRTNDILDGGLGADTLLGGLGNDVYNIDNVLDIVLEDAGQGGDSIHTTLNSYTLGDTIETLCLDGTANLNGTGNALANALYGNSGKNILTGGKGNDSLHGGTGIDTLIGGLGNDTYWVNVSTDIVTENTGEGTDTVHSIASSYILGANIENLVMDGTASISGTGNMLNNTLTGNSGSNRLTGGEGDDTLNGGSRNLLPDWWNGQ